MRNNIRKRSEARGNTGFMTCRPAGIMVALLLLITAAAAQQPGGPSPADTLWPRLQKAFEAKDFEAYAAVFSESIRKNERLAAATFSESWKMDKVLFKPAGQVNEKEGRLWIYVQVLYQNEYSAMLETWLVQPVEDQGRWFIGEKAVTGSVTTLYKLKMPAGRALRGARVEIRHQDVRIAFENAWVYFDNLPDSKTALIILGDGRLQYNPSNAAEKHQLQLRYGETALDDKLDSAYLRFSPAFFQSNITISGGAPPESSNEARAQANRAYSIFSKNYPSSFTIENSLTSGLLSYMPQGDQAVFDLQTRRKGSLSYIYSPFSEEEIHLVSRDADEIINLYSPQTGEPGARRMFVSFDQKMDVLDYQIDLDFQPYKSYLSARARIEVVSPLESMDSLKFNLNPRLDIVRIYDAEGQELFYTQDRYRDLLYIYFLRPVEKGRPTTVEVFYRGVLEPPVQTTDVIAQGALNRVLSPPSAVRFETYLFSQSALWYPAPTEEDFFTAKMRIIVPPGYSCVANGRPVEEGKIDGVRRVTSLDKVGNPYFGFDSKIPVKYLSFIVGKFETLPNGPGNGSSVPVDVRVSSDIRFARKGLIDEAKSILKTFEGWFGPFPFEKLTIVQRQWPTAGGHSPASFIVLNELPRTSDGFMVANPNSPVDLSRWKESFLAHEIAHQWWGQGVAGASYRDQWLSEGLAQFAAVRYLKAKVGDEAYLAAIAKFTRWTEKKSKWGPISLGSRLSYLDFEAYQSLVYDKSALILIMLMDLVGEETFFRGLREFFADYKFKSARTANFRAVMENVSGRDLKGFFELWFGSHFLPEASVSTAAKKQGEAFVLQVRVTQKGQPFVFPLWLAWEEDGRVFRRMLEINAAVKEFNIPCAAHPGRIKIDPDRMLPGRIN
jgi:hypothetical protein